MNNNMDFEYLSFNEQNDSDGLTGEVTVSLMPMMREKYEYSPTAMKIDEDLTEELSHSETDSIEKQTITDQVSVKDPALDASITKSTAYRFKK
ncbi:hypothetical protein BDF21DRAFT_324390, partial [Thamnidium elegans]